MKLDPVTAGRLLDRYGALLTEHQRRCLELYYDQDYSLAEIAEQTGVSRQGVHASIARAETALCAYEEALGCVAFDGKLRAALERIRAEAVRLSGGESEGAAKTILLTLDALEEGVNGI